MPLRLQVYLGPTAEPLHLTDVKLHLRLAATAADAVLYMTDDTVLNGYIAAARAVAENETWKPLVLRVYDLYLDEWPAGDEIRLPMPPLREVVSIVYTDSDGTEATFAATEYEVDTSSTPGRIVLGYDKSWPDVTLAPSNPIRIRFSAGYVVPFTVSTGADTLTAGNHPFADGDITRLSVSGGSLPTGLTTMTDYHVRDVLGDTFKLSATAGGEAIDISATGVGLFFAGEIPESTLIGMKLIISDLYEERGDTAYTRGGLSPALLPRGAAHFFAMDSVRVPW